MTGAGAAYRRDRATWVAFAALFAFGVLNALLGPALPYLRRTEHLTYVAGALHQAAFALGGMTAGALAARSHADRRRTIVLGLAGAGAAALLLGYGDRLALTLAGALLCSAFATAALIRLWASLADRHGAHRAVAMTEGEVAVSLAGIATPSLIAVCAASVLGWRAAFVVAAVVVAAAVTAVALGPRERLVAAEPDGDAVDAATVARGGSRRGLVTIFAVVGAEFTISFWGASWLHDDVGIARDAAAALVSVGYAANLVGRVVASRLARRRPAASVLFAALVLVLAGSPVLLAADTAAVAVLGLLITGIGIGATFPLASALHVASSRRTADQALGEILVVAGVGQIVAPLAAGVIAQRSSLTAGLLVLPVLALLAAGTVRTPRSL
ncbi:MAG: MFS transporter [Jatrophihabitans sp.]|uniref:MFS transporter n=1 Tax=Jatrophihabitans sp. TaxID=1932789 RepID=UPI003F7E56B2